MKIEAHLLNSNINMSLFIIEIQSDSIHAGRGAFGPYMIFKLNIRSPIGAPTEDLTLIGGSIEWDVFSSFTRFSPFQIPLQPILINREIVIPVLDSYIHKINELRISGQDIRLKISLHGVCQISSLPLQEQQKRQAEVNNADRNMIGRSLTVSTSSDSTLFINRDKWRDLLAFMGYESYRLIELPQIEFVKKLGERWDKASSRLDKVLKKERVGDYEECVVEARLLIEEILNAFAYKFSINFGATKETGKRLESFQSQISSIITNDFSKDQMTSFINLLFSLNNFTRAYHHPREHDITLFGNLRQQAAYVVTLSTVALSTGAHILLWNIPSISE